MRLGLFVAIYFLRNKIKICYSRYKINELIPAFNKKFDGIDQN